jgi:hypothetical protein
MISSAEALKSALVFCVLPGSAVGEAAAKLFSAGNFSGVWDFRSLLKAMSESFARRIMRSTVMLVASDCL